MPQDHLQQNCNLDKNVKSPSTGIMSVVVLYHFNIIQSDGTIKAKNMSISINRSDTLSSRASDQVFDYNKA